MVTATALLGLCVVWDQPVIHKRNAETIKRATGFKSPPWRSQSPEAVFKHKNRGKEAETVRNVPEEVSITKKRFGLRVCALRISDCATDRAHVDQLTG